MPASITSPSCPSRKPSAICTTCSSTSSTRTSPRPRTAMCSRPASPARFRSSRTGSPRSPRSFPRPFSTSAPTKPWTSAVAAPSEQVESQGYGPVYVAFLKQIHDELAPLHRRLLFWGDIGGADPAAVAGLPKDMIAVPWNYWDTTGFDKMIEPFAKAGIETWVAPGDANWNEVYPDSKNRALEYSGLHPRRPASGLHRRHQHRLERRRRRPLQPGLVRRAVWPGGGLAGRREPHSRLSGGLRASLPRRLIRQDQRGREGTDGRPRGSRQCQLRAFSSDAPLLARPMERSGTGRSRQSCCRWRRICASTPSAPSCCWPRRARPTPN